MLKIILLLIISVSYAKNTENKPKLPDMDIGSKFLSNNEEYGIINNAYIDNNISANSSNSNWSKQVTKYNITIYDKNTQQPQSFGVKTDNIVAFNYRTQNPVIVTNNIVIKLKDNDFLNDIVKQYNLVLLAHFKHLNIAVVIPNKNTITTLNKIQKDKGVLTAKIDIIEFEKTTN